MARKKKEELLVIDTTEKNILLDDKNNKEAIINELKEYIDEKINDTFMDELERANKKLIREKNKKIVWKNIFIIILFLIIGFLLFLMYKDNYFDRLFNSDKDIEEKEKKEEKEEQKEDNKEDNKQEEEKKEDKKEEKKEPTLEELKKQYESLLDNYYVTDESIYLSDFYDGKLTIDMMKYMTLNSFNFSSFVKEEDYNIIKESTFQIMFEKLFNDEYISGSFNYEDNKVRYVKQMESYMTESLLVRVDSHIKREIKDIKVDGNKIIITTIEGLIKDNKLYNVVSNELVNDFKEDTLLKYEDKLNKVIYTFQDNKLISLSK